MTKETHNHIEPYKTDFLFRLVTLISRDNPFYTGLVYFLISFVGIYSIGIATGQFLGKNNLPPMYSPDRFIDNINLGFLAPIGAVLLHHLYKSICSTTKWLNSGKIISKNESEKFDNLIKKFEQRYNNKYVVIGTFLISSLCTF